MKVSQAVQVLSQHLKDDPDYWHSWMCNISVLNQDQGLSRDKADLAADQFLKNLTREVK